MKAIVFAGPSIPRDRIESIPGFEWRAPVSQGDVYLAAKSAPTAIAIVDGYFEGVPSVWHKEILWAMSRGIHVFGASSMGALRAAELHPFGMHGVGEIFETYRDGVYEDDDEVAVLHGPAELGYLPVNVPMVNVRATLENALSEGVIDTETAEKTALAAKSIFYQVRQWKSVFAAAEKLGVEDSTMDSLKAWLPGGQRDLKREDAEELMSELQKFLSEKAESPGPNFHFEWTVMWDSVASGQTEKGREIGNRANADLESLMIDELRVRPDLYKSVARRARLKQMALREAERKRVTINIDQVRDRLRNLREEQGLYSRTQLDEWMSQNDLCAESLQSLLEDEQKELEIAAGFAEIDPHILINELRALGKYAEIKAYAEKTLSAVSTVSVGQSQPNPAELLAWYFEKCLKESIPDNLDDYIAGIDLSNREEFYRLIKNHYLFALANGTERQ